MSSYIWCRAMYRGSAITVWRMDDVFSPATVVAVAGWVTMLVIPRITL